MKNLKLLPLSLAAVMGLSLLSGCAAAPKSASAVVEKYVSQMEKSCNYHRSEEHTSEHQSPLVIEYAVF